ncbi:MAG: signal peptide peptidase SppA [Paracoccaceae bacterium]
MTATADLIIERRRMRRRLALWRILAIVAAVAFLIAIAALSGALGGASGGAHVARVDITGLILNDPERHERLRRLAKDGEAEAVIVRIDSPGGSVAGSEELYEDLRAIAEAKPLVAQMGSAAASGGYIAAIAAEHIVAYGNTITGSIGVVAQAPNIAELLERAGIDVIEIKSSPLKAEPDPLTRLPDGAIEAQERIVADSYAWFRGLVSERRGLDGQALDTVSDGRIFTGRQALDNGLVDGIGGADTVDDYLAETHEVGRDLPRRDITWGEEEFPFPLGAALAALGLDPALWQPAAHRLTPGLKLYALMP